MNLHEMNDGLFGILRSMQKTPSDFLRSNTLVNLRHFLLGYELCSSFVSKTYPYMFLDFQKFIESKYMIEPTTNHYLHIIDSQHSNEQEAFDEFFELLEEFLGYCNASVTDSHGTKESDLDNFNLDEEYFKILGFMRKRYGFYLDTPCLRKAEAFLNGFHTCAKSSKVPFAPHKGFDVYVKEKYGERSRTNVYDIIADRHNDKEALGAFFDTLEEFLMNNGMFRQREILIFANLV